MQYDFYIESFFNKGFSEMIFIFSFIVEIIR